MSDTLLLLSLGVSLALTLFLELGFFLVLGFREKRDLSLCVLVNLLTNPPVVLLARLSALYAPGCYPSVVALLAGTAVLTEALLYRGIGGGRVQKHPFLLSLGANAFSYAAGLLLCAIS